MQKFSDVLPKLGDADNIQRIELSFGNGTSAGVIENKPGSTGSIKMFNYLYKTFGSISVEAATEGLSLYCEHTADAEANPGKHPNIDRLVAIIQNKAPLTVKVIAP
ncbi:MAG: hypothetical protein COB34_05615 [Methylophilaceae bacterium]|nr:MAG: hypothetical protein COB34_05615 [Methylophilaceae bacterium]